MNEFVSLYLLALWTTSFEKQIIHYMQQTQVVKIAVFLLVLMVFKERWSKEMEDGMNKIFPGQRDGARFVMCVLMRGRMNVASGDFGSRVPMTFAFPGVGEHEVDWWGSWAVITFTPGHGLCGCFVKADCIKRSPSLFAGFPSFLFCSPPLFLPCSPFSVLFSWPTDSWPHPLWCSVIHAALAKRSPLSLFPPVPHLSISVCLVRRRRRLCGGGFCCGVYEFPQCCGLLKPGGWFRYCILYACIALDPCAHCSVWSWIIHFVFTRLKRKRWVGAGCKRS